MKSIVLSSLLAGFIAGFIWMAITALTGGSKAAIVGGGFGFLVGTAVVAGIITAIISRSKQRAA